MYKKDALRILFETSQKYKEELCGKNLLFVSADTHKNVDFFGKNYQKQKKIRNIFKNTEKSAEENKRSPLSAFRLSRAARTHGLLNLKDKE